MPLAGDDLYITEEFFQQYSQAANRFLLDIVNYFDAHGDEYYPRGLNRRCKSGRAPRGAVAEPF